MSMLPPLLPYPFKLLTQNHSERLSETNPSDSESEITRLRAIKAQDVSSEEESNSINSVLANKTHDKLPTEAEQRTIVAQNLRSLRSLSDLSKEKLAFQALNIK